MYMGEEMVGRENGIRKVRDNNEKSEIKVIN